MIQRCRSWCLVLLVLTLSGCFTSSLSWNDEGHRPQVVAPEAAGEAWELSYQRDRLDPTDLYELDAAGLSPFRYEGEPDLAQVRVEADDTERAAARLEALLQLRPVAGINLLSLDSPLWQARGEAATAFACLKPEAARELRGAWLAARQALPADERPLSESAPLQSIDFPELRAVLGELDAGRVPTSVEVFVVPNVIPLTGGEVAGNVGTVLVAPFAVLLDVVTFPFQAVYFLVINDDAVWIGAPPR